MVMWCDFIFVFLASYLCWVCGDVTLLQDTFHERGHICNMENLRDHDCLSLGTGRLSKSYKLQCVAQCSRLTNCVGILWTPGETCLLHVVPCSVTVLEASPSCSNPKTSILYLLRQTPDCGDHGVWDSDHLKCVCSDGLVGDRCERYAASCRDLWESGYPKTSRKRFYLQPPGYTAPRIIMCAFKKEIRTFFGINHGENIFSNRSWDEYVTGFSAFDSSSTAEDHWLGLELMHHFTTTYNISKIRVVVDLKTGSIKYEYSDFELRGKAENYAAHALLQTFKLNTTRGDTQTDPATYGADGCFTSHENMYTPFSTSDHHSEVTVGGPCASQADSGWWFTSCASNPVCNPLGQFYSSSTQPVQMYHLHTPFVDLQKVYDITRRIRMMLVEPSS